MSDIFVGIIIGALAVNAIWIVVSWIRGKHVDGSLTFDFSGEGEPVSLDLSGFKTMHTAKRVILSFNTIYPEEKTE